MMQWLSPSNWKGWHAAIIVVVLAMIGYFVRNKLLKRSAIVLAAIVAAVALYMKFGPSKGG